MMELSDELKRELDAALASTPMFDWSRAGVRISLTEMCNPGRKMQDSLLNPESLPMDVAVSIGELNPVGASHSVLQYGHTKSPDVPIELYFSRALQGRVPSLVRAGATAIEATGVVQYVRWLESFCFGPERGVAPSPMLLLWPGVCHIALAISAVRPRYIRFARNLHPIAVQVSLECKELRFSYKNSGEQRDDGYSKLDPLLRTGGSTYTGGNLNLSSGKR